ncbi:MAG TPA: zf-HC2 domain-containing protein [Thermoanaerobaculia bacterium]
MTALCEKTRAALPEYLAESLAPSERRALRAHLSVCAACRAEAATLDPTLVFAAAGTAAAASPAEVASIVVSVRTGIALRQAERKIAPAAPSRAGRRGPRAAAAAAVLLLTLAISSGSRPSVPSVAAAPSVPAATAASIPAPEAGVSVVASPEGAAKSSGGATVYDWNPGAGEPRVVWIVDGSLDI